MACGPIRSPPSRRSRSRAVPRSSLEQEGVAWNAGIFLWRRRAIRTALERYTGLIQLIGPTITAPTLLQHAYEQLKPVSIDYAVMESAARDGQVVMASMDVGWSDLGSWSSLLAAIGARGEGAVVQAGETRHGRGRRPRRAAARRTARASSSRRSAVA